MKYLPNTRSVVEYTKHHISGETLDFGAGTAKYQSIIRPYTSKYTTFDMLPGRGIDVVGDALNPPFKKEQFDTVISTQVLEHVRKPWIMISEIGRILKSGGVCIMTAPFIVPYHSDPHDYFRYTKEGIESMFTDNGFEIVDSGSYGRIFLVFSEMIHFSFFNPYTPSGSTKWARRIMRYVEKIAVMLDRLVKSKIIYANVFVVARKI